MGKEEGNQPWGHKRCLGRVEVLWDPAQPELEGLRRICTFICRPQVKLSRPTSSQSSQHRRQRKMSSLSCTGRGEEADVKSYYPWLHCKIFISDIKSGGGQEEGRGSGKKQVRGAHTRQGRIMNRISQLCSYFPPEHGAETL